MNPWTITGLLILVIGMALLGGMVEETFLSGDEVSNLEALMTKPETAVSSVPIIGPVADFMVMVWDWLQAFWNLLWMDYPFFEGPFVIVRVLFLCFSAGIVASFLLAIRGTSGA